MFQEQAPHEAMGVSVFFRLYRNVGFQIPACVDGGQVNWDSFWEGHGLYTP